MPNNLAQNLLSLRTKLNISRREFCERIKELDPKGRELKNTTYGNHELGPCEPPLDTLVLYAELHGVTIDKLIKTKII